MQYPKKFLMLILTAVFVLPAAAWAKPEVSLSIQAEKEVTVTEDGEQVVKRLPATEAAPGETVIFTITYTNTGDEPATKVVVSDPIPEGTDYVPGSATETGAVAFSIDGGETYKEPSSLTYEVTNPDGTKESRTATPEQYTHIRWQIPEIPPGQTGELGFRVLVR